MSFDPVPSLIYVLLIISGVALFLCVFNLLFLRELSKKIRETRRTAREGGQETSSPDHPGRAGSTPRSANPAGTRDISSEVRLIAERYALDSLVIASHDGLVVASAGSNDPEHDAAYYTDVLARNVSFMDRSVRMFEFICCGLPLVGIIRKDDFGPDETGERIKADIRSVFDSYLGQNKVISGEII